MPISTSRSTATSSSSWFAKGAEMADPFVGDAAESPIALAAVPVHFAPVGELDADAGRGAVPDVAQVTCDGSDHGCAHSGSRGAARRRPHQRDEHLVVGSRVAVPGGRRRRRAGGHERGRVAARVRAYRASAAWTRTPTPAHRVGTCSSPSSTHRGSTSPSISSARTAKRSVATRTTCRAPRASRATRSTSRRRTRPACSRPIRSRRPVIRTRPRRASSGCVRDGSVVASFYYFDGGHGGWLTELSGLHRRRHRCGRLGGGRTRTRAGASSTGVPHVEGTLPPRSRRGCSEASKAALELRARLPRGRQRDREPRSRTRRFRQDASWMIVGTSDGIAVLGTTVGQGQFGGIRLRTRMSRRTPSRSVLDDGTCERERGLHASISCDRADGWKVWGSD